MKKVLIWDIFPLQNVGGASGYLYNLHEYLITHPCPQVVFLSDLVSMTNAPYPWERKERLTLHNNYLCKLYKRISSLFGDFVKYKWTLPSNIDLNDYDYIHVHLLPHVMQIKLSFPSFKGKIILTSHCPCPFTEEWIDQLITPTQKMRFFRNPLKRWLYKQEFKTYRIVDYIMFPCVGAREPYEKNIEIKKIFNNEENKFFYVPTGIIDYKPELSKIQKLSELGIPPRAFVITFFGRHNHIKGYDILKRVGIELLNKIPNLYVLCAGKGDIEPPQHQRWIELGFINNVDDLLLQSDLYILPNRETFFDLIVLQVLRAGVPIVLSRTGGNKYFETIPLNSTGICFFEINNIAALENVVIKQVQLREQSPQEYTNVRKTLYELYERLFSMKYYVQNYIRSIDAL